MLSQDHKDVLKDVTQGTVVSQKVIAQLRPIIEQYKESGSIFLKRKLDKYTVLTNKIFNDIINTGNATQSDVVELKVVLQDLKEIGQDMIECMPSVDKGEAGLLALSLELG